jgi:hypothetical protein
MEDYKTMKLCPERFLVAASLTLRDSSYVLLDPAMSPSGDGSDFFHDGVPASLNSKLYDLRT